MAPVKDGQTAGYIRYYLGEELVREFPVKTAGNVERRTLAWCGGEVWKRVGF